MAVPCARCGKALTPVFSSEVGLETLQLEGALHLEVWGGYGEFLDVFEQDPALSMVLCSECAKLLVDTFPFLKKRVFRHLNLNIGHVCAGAQVWVPEPKCTKDPDQHGWRKVFAVVPDPAHTLAYGLYSSRSEAEKEALSQGASVVETIVANAEVYRSVTGEPLPLPR